MTVILEPTVFTPTRRAREARAMFWSNLEKNPLIDPEHLSEEQFKKLSYWPKITDHLGEAGFKEWFLNALEFRARMLYLADMATEQLEEILTDPDTSAKDRLAAIKEVMELADRKPKKSETVFADKQIGEMSRHQLDEYINKHKALLIGVDNANKL